jgi:hypothetical protein
MAKQTQKNHNLVLIDAEARHGKRILTIIGQNGDFRTAAENLSKKVPQAVQFVNPHTGETIKGPKYDTTTQEVDGNVNDLLRKMGYNVTQKPPVEDDMRHEPRDRQMENRNMKRESFKDLIAECIAEVKSENEVLTNPRVRLKESLRGIVKTVLNEMAANVETKPDKEEKEKISKGFNKKGNERLDKNNSKLKDELETIVHGINKDWQVYWDDNNELNVNARSLLHVRIKEKFENNFDIDAMVKLSDRVRAIALTWDQVKDFVKANFSSLTNTTKADDAKTKAMDHLKDREVIKKNAGPDGQTVKPRYISPDEPHIKDTKKDNKDYNEPAVKKDEDMPDQPMKKVTEPGKDPDSKNKNIDKTTKVKAPKHKNDNTLRVDADKTKKFREKKS